MKSPWDMELIKLIVIMILCYNVHLKKKKLTFGF